MVDLLAVGPVRCGLLALVVVLATGACGGAGGEPVPAARPPARATHPNVLLVVIDDMNDWVAPLNDGRRGKPLVEAPSLQALASQSTLFVNAHTPAPVCAPARASILTGLYPRNGDRMVAAFQDRQFDSTVTLVEHFRHHGYRAIGGGKLYPNNRSSGRYWDEFDSFGRSPAERRRGPAKNGFALSGDDQFDWGPMDLPEKDLAPVRLAAWAVEHLKTLDRERPFFLGVGFRVPHLPWYLPKRRLDSTPLESVALPVVREDDVRDLQVGVWGWRGDHREVVEAGVWSQAVRAYIAASRLADEMVGRVLDGLRESRHYHNTIVVVFSDHGWHLGEKQHWRKGTLWEESTRVPLMVRFPPRLPVGAVVQAPASLVDVYPTLVDLAGLPPVPHELDGVSLVELAAGRAERSAVMTTSHLGSALRDEHWRYIRYAQEYRAPELYDHREDPMEHANLLVEPDAWTRHEERLRRYDAFLDRYHPR